MNAEEKRIRDLVDAAKETSVRNSSAGPKKRVSINGFVGWLLPAAMAVLGHVEAGWKADLPGTGPGFHIANMNAETIWIIGLWHVLETYCWVFALYAGLLLAIYGALGYFRVRFVYRFIFWVIVAAPGFWYFWKMAYLSGKILSVG